MSRSRLARSPHRRTTLSALSILTALTIAGCSGSDDQGKDTSSIADLEPLPPTGGEPGTYGLTLEHNGVTREAIVHVPASYDASASTGIMLNFHGFDGTASSQMDWADMRDLADRDGHIVVYPQGTYLDGSPHWNSALPGGDNKSDADDLGFVRELLALIGETYPYDTERVYASGYSNGGMMAAALACHASDLVAAFAIVSGAQLEVGDICAPTHPTAVITLHGTADYVLPYNGDAETPSVQATLDFWTTHNFTEREPTRDSATSGTMTIERSTYNGGTNGVSVVHYRYQEGGHVWFSEEYEGENASALVWNFTTRHNIQGAL